MLDRTKLFAKLEDVISEIFIDTTEQNRLIQVLWNQLIEDKLLREKLAGAMVSWMLPTWNNNDLDARYMVTLPEPLYDVIAVDGSQIYPDRHTGVSCFVINIGEVIFRYGCDSPVSFATYPYVYSGNEQDYSELSPEVINGKRQDLELKAGLMGMKKIGKQEKPQLLLFDGSLIFWHLEAKDIVLQELFLPRYFETLLLLYQEHWLCASYISAPKSRELIHIIKAYACNFNEKNQYNTELFSRCTDTALLYSFLSPYQRTIVFKNHAKVSALYPHSIHPHFFYMHVGTEIGRVEIPAWIAENELLVNTVASLVLDQCRKGYGYPISLAEAHEQAVIKGSDRDFFYHLLQKVSIEQNKKMHMSQKIMKKRGMGI